MFEPQDTPRLFGLGMGVDFPKALVAGLQARLIDHSPETLARITIFVNTTRMARRTRQLFQQTGATLLPRIRLITELGHDPRLNDLPPAANPLQSRLTLSVLVRKLITTEPDLASQASAFDLADSLATLMEEMHSEGIPPQAVLSLDVAQHSAHWRRAQKFIEIVQPFFSEATAPDPARRQRMVVERLLKTWAKAPPPDPIIVAGSTGSRATTNMFMQAVARLPQGALILPGFDFDMPEHVWDTLSRKNASNMASEDHPQYRFKSLLDDLGCDVGNIAHWHDLAPVSVARNRLVSLALRPAPVTDGWMQDGARLEGLGEAMSGVTLLEAPSPRIEATAIALRLRKAVEDGKRAALITPDRTLTRQVTAALQRWQIEPDDSAGTPLAQSAPGRLLRQTAELMHTDLSADLLLGLLKHPLVSRYERNEHLRRTRDLELEVLRRDTPFPTRERLLQWAARRDSDPAARSWVDWLYDCLKELEGCDKASLDELIKRHIAVTERLSAGLDAQEPGNLWNRKGGETARGLVDRLLDAAPAGGDLRPKEYGDLFGAVLTLEEVREPIAPHPDVMIWGTLEARVQGADLVILSGLNEGIWPETSKPDPWLNRQMRKDAGLLLPERQIGLAAHDFQQAIAAPEVWITRSTRDAESETVASRWVNRLCNLLSGLPGEGADALSQMRARGQHWLDMVDALERPEPVAPATRPAPQPPTDQRPRKLSVTRIETLIRDPYAIYAAYVLRLRKLGDLKTEPDAPLRGEALHKVLHQFVDQTRARLPENALDLLLSITDQVFSQDVPWPATRALWRAKLERSANKFLEAEAEIRKIATPRAFEATGARRMVAPEFTLEGRADRIDVTEDGELILIDYKTGALPSKKVQEHFNKQLPLLAAIADRDGFAKLTGLPVLQARYIGLGAKPGQTVKTFEPGELDQIWEALTRLIATFAHQSQGYSSRRAVDGVRFEGDYDHLARFGEWDETQPPDPVEVGS